MNAPSPEFPLSSLRYIREWGAWLWSDGRRWVRDRDGEVERMAKHIARIMHEDVVHLADRAEGSALSKHAFRSESEPRIKAMISLARSEMDIAVVPEKLDSETWAFNVLNGRIDLRTHELRLHDQADLITKLAPVEYDPNAKAETFDPFSLEIMDGRAELEVEDLAAAISEARKTVCAELLETLPDRCEALPQPLVPTSDIDDRAGAEEDLARHAEMVRAPSSTMESKL